MSESSFGDAVTALNAANAEGESTPASTPTEAPPSFSQTQAPQNEPVAGAPTAAPYAEYLEKIPEGFRGVVEPIFKEWDKGVSQRFEQVHSRYEPYKFLAEQRADPNDIRQAMELQRLLVEDPQRVYEALAEHFGADQGQGQALDEPQEEFDLGEGEQTQFDITKHPQFQQLQQQQQALIEGMQQAQQAQQQRQMEAEGEQWLEERHSAAEKYLTEKVGITPDKTTWNYIYGVALGISQSNPNGDNDAAFAQAVDAYVQNLNQMRQLPTRNSQAPTVLPTGGGTPSNVLNPDMSDQERRKTAVAMFSAALKD